MIPALSRPAAAARVAGLLYLVIIVAGVAGEALVRGALAVPGEPQQTAANIVAAALPLRLSVMGDAVMALADVALGVLLYLLLRPVSPALSLMAMAFRLAQAAILGVNLLNLLLAARLAGQGDPLAAVFLEAHGVGYDLGLLFFAINCLLVGALVYRGMSRTIGALVGLSGVVYLVGSTLRVVAPELAAAAAPAYVLPLVAELALCGALLMGRAPRPAAAA
ncbi:MAG: DUF4386 domain-containing protein [Nannocystaceae bacterium]